MEARQGDEVEDFSVVKSDCHPEGNARRISLFLLIGLLFIPMLLSAEPLLPIPFQGAYTGAYLDFGLEEDNVKYETIEKFQSMVGKEQAIVAFSSDWGKKSFPMAQLETVARYGAVPLVFWLPWYRPGTSATTNTEPLINLGDVLNGRWDAYIDQWADGARTFSKPFFVSWALEMNGNWFPWSGVFYSGDRKDKNCKTCSAGPEIFKNAYRYVVDRVKRRGTTNIIWVWHANNTSDPEEKWNTMAAYYPGPEYADWIAMSAYGKQYTEQGWVSVDRAITLPYQQLANVDEKKPVMLAEWGIGEFPKEGSKAEWLREFFEKAPEFPRLKAAVFWHERWQNGDLTYSNLRVNSSPESLAAYKTGVASPFWVGRIPGMPN